MGRDQARKDLQETVKQFSAYRPDSKNCAFAYIFYKGLLLLAQRSDDDSWAVAGGHAIVGEDIEDTLKREVEEESGIDLDAINAATDILGSYSFRKPNGDNIHIYIINLSDLPEGMKHTDEMRNYGWFHLDCLPQGISKATHDTLISPDFLGILEQK